MDDKRMRQIITGKVHLSRMRKAHRNWIVDMCQMIAEDKGKRVPQYYPDFFAVFTGGGDLSKQLCYKQKSGRTPKALLAVGDKDIVTFSCIVDLWDNNLGGTIRSVKLISIEKAEREDESSAV